MDSPFSRLPPLKPDPIFTIAQAAAAAGSNAVNLSIGVLLDDEGLLEMPQTLLDAVHAYSAQFGREHEGYPPLLGVRSFREHAAALILGEADVLHASVATTGGTGAITVNLRLIAAMDSATTIILPVPTWANHPAQCRSAGLAAQECVYFMAGAPSTHGIIEAVKKCQGSCAVLLQACCHNPTGLDFSAAQWEELASVLSERKVTVLLDFAYQGLGTGQRDDANVIHILSSHHVPLLIAWSASKNHSLYGLRTGLALALVANNEERERVEDAYAAIIRQLHSPAPTTGQYIVSWVQENRRTEWERELADIRAQLIRKRQLLIGACPRWSASLKGNGLFAQLPLSDDQLVLIARDHSMFLGPGGRINIAGIRTDKLSTVAQALSAA